MDIDGLTVIQAQSGLPLFSKLNHSIDETLFSGILTAIQNFANELSLGGLSSFTTDEKTIFLTNREYITIAVIAPKELDFKKVYSLAYSIGEKFEAMYDLTNIASINTEQFKSFHSVVDRLLNEIDVPFIIKVAEFAKKEFGGSVSVQPKLKDKKGEIITTIDVMVDRGKKRIEKGIRNKLISKLHKAFSEDITFVKAIPATAGRGEVQDFLDLIDKFGGPFSSDTQEEGFRFFPSRVAIIAFDFSPTIKEILEKLPKDNSGVYIGATHVIPTANFSAAPKILKCYIEFWLWHNDKYPELYNPRGL